MNKSKNRDGSKAREEKGHKKHQNARKMRLGRRSRQTAPWSFFLCLLVFFVAILEHGRPRFGGLAFKRLVIMDLKRCIFATGETASNQQATEVGWSRGKRETWLDQPCHSSYTNIRSPGRMATFLI